MQRSLDAKVTRFGDPFAALADRPAAEADPAQQSASTAQAKPAAGAATPARAAALKPVNLLVLGSDSRISAGDPSQWSYGAQRTDTIMLVHIPADRRRVYVTSFPRDAWVSIPGHGRSKLNAAFSWGGPALSIATIEKLTGVRIDHIMITDFNGFARITDLLGGVDITLPQSLAADPTTKADARAFTAGTHHMDGATALAYVRERKHLPNGDLDRVKRQQNWLRAVARTATAQGMAKDPARIYEMLDALASSIATDSAFTTQKMRQLVMSVRHVGKGGAVFMTAPVSGSGFVDGQSVVHLDTRQLAGLSRAIRKDDVQNWLDSTGYPTLGASVR